MCLPAAGRDCGIKNPLSLLPLDGGGLALWSRGFYSTG
jgi:hypothetical protein